MDQKSRTKSIRSNLHLAKGIVHGLRNDTSAKDLSKYEFRTILQQIATTVLMYDTTRNHTQTVDRPTIYTDLKTDSEGEK